MLLYRKKGSDRLQAELMNKRERTRWQKRLDIASKDRIAFSPFVSGDNDTARYATEVLACGDGGIT